MLDKKKKMVIYLEITMVSAVAFALSYVPLQLFHAAIDLSLGFIPIAILAVRRGIFPAMIAGAIWGVLAILTGKAEFLTILQVMMDYPVAFSFGGLVGIFSFQIKVKRKFIFWIILASFLGAFARWFWHFVAGFLFWGNYAPKSMNPFFYSLLVNGISCILNALILSVVLIFVVKKAKFLLSD
ncbi:MAG: energy-coupled thiamine transporter ThiT [Streptococcaceae bacterium]|jgi:thiamine transporter|nr:energy-coupled thiamine transporter ThiT [Streptococcaceae bacterium]